MLESGSCNLKAKFMLSDLAFDIPSLHQAYQSGVSPAAVFQECLKRIADAADPGIFIWQSDWTAIAQQLQQLGDFNLEKKPLWGIPYVVKDNIDVDALPTTAACPDFRYIAAQTATVVHKLQQAGAILVGKTNLDQFATGLVGLRTPYPAPKNALDDSLVPGGSSSGSATAVARGLVSFSLGTDTAGSGRVPAALNGIVGLKPSLGAVSCTGVVPACRSLDTVSVFALNVADAWSVYSQIHGFDETDAYARELPLGAMIPPPAHFKLGVPSRASQEFFGDECQAEAYQQALMQLQSLGAELVEIDFAPFYAVAQLLYQGSWVAERYVVIESLLQQQPEAVLPVTREVITQAEQYSAADAFRDFYELQRLRAEIEPLLQQVYALCVPSIPTLVRVADVEQDPLSYNSRLGTYTNFVNLLDLCGITVPSAARADGLPGSVTLLARAGRDAYIAAIAERLQRQYPQPIGATDWALPEFSPLAPAATAPREPLSPIRQVSAASLPNP